MDGFGRGAATQTEKVSNGIRTHTVYAWAPSPQPPPNQALLTREPPRGPIGMSRGPRVGPGGPNLDFVGGGKWGKVGPQGQRDPPRGARRRVSATAANLVHGASDMSASRPETIFKVVRGPNPGGGILGLFWKTRGPISGDSPYAKYPTPRARDPHIQVRRPMVYRFP